MTLAAAARQLDAGEVEPALASLLELWRRTRAAAVAELVEAIATGLPPIQGAKREFDQVWRTIAQRRNPIDLPRLIESIARRGAARSSRVGDQVGTPVLLARAKLLAAWPPDPRTASATLSLLEDAPDAVFDPSRRPFWNALLDLVVTHGDPRAIAVLERARALRRFRGTSSRATWFQKRAQAATAQLGYVSGGSLDRSAAELCKRLMKRAGKARAQLATGIARSDASARDDATAPTSPREAAAIATRSAHEPLGKALAAANRGEPEAALESLLDAWRASRAPRVADLIARVSSAIEARLPSLASASTFPTKTERAAAQRAWLEVAAARRSSDLPRLVGSLTSCPSTDALERVTAIATWPADPRTTPGIERHLQKPRYYAGSTKLFWTALFDFVVAQADPRALEVLDRLVGRFAKLLPSESSSPNPMASWFERTAVAAASRLRSRYADAHAALSRADDAACERILERLADGRDRSAALLAAVYAHPDDDGPRQVYGDLLQERGDPHGELIALQLADRDPARQAALVAAHAKALLGPFAPHVSRFLLGRCTFRRGFPYELWLDDVAELIGHPAWATVRRLELRLDDEAALPAELLRHPVMARLEHLGGLDLAHTRELLSWNTIPMASLGLHLNSFDSVSVVDRLLAARRALRALRSLELGSWDGDCRWLWKSWLGGQLRELRVSTKMYELDLRRWFAQLADDRIVLERLELAYHDCGTVVTTRGRDGAFSELTAALGTSTSRGDRSQLLRVETLASELAGLPPNALTKLAVVGRPPRKAELASLAAALARFPGIEFDWRTADLRDRASR